LAERSRLRVPSVNRPSTSCDLCSMVHPPLVQHLSKTLELEPLGLEKEPLRVAQ
jgi:hypothetical protein